MLIAVLIKFKAKDTDLKRKHNKWICREIERDRDIYRDRDRDREIER